MNVIASRCILAAVALGVSALVLRAAESKFILPSDSRPLKPGPGLEFVQTQCALCHSLDYISTQPRLTRAQWQASIVKMQQKYGAPVPADKVAPLVEYLVKNYGAEKSESAK
jgi:hypothetical protein